MKTTWLTSKEVAEKTDRSRSVVADWIARGAFGIVTKKIGGRRWIRSDILKRIPPKKRCGPHAGMPADLDYKMLCSQIEKRGSDGAAKLHDVAERTIRYWRAALQQQMAVAGQLERKSFRRMIGIVNELESMPNKKQIEEMATMDCSEQEIGMLIDTRPCRGRLALSQASQERWRKHARGIESRSVLAIGSKALRGEQHKGAKLTERKVLEARRRLDAGESCATLAKEYHVQPTTMSKIKRRKTWGWLEE